MKDNDSGKMCCYECKLEQTTKLYCQKYLCCGTWFYNDIGASQYFNDLWKFDLYIKQWTWVSGDSIPDQKAVYGVMGTPDARNKPRPRKDAVGWTDPSGDLWLFGGFVWAVGSFNDLWKFPVFPANGPG